MGSLLKLITKLFGKNALGKTLGTRTNVIKLPNNEKKRLIKNELDIERASDAAAQKVLEEAKELIPDLPKMNDMERLVFEGNLRRLDNRLNPPSAEVVEFGTKKPMSEAGIKQLAAEKGFPEGVDPESTMGRLLTSTRKLQDEAEKLKTQTPSQQFEDLLKNPYRSGGPLDPKSGIVRTAARQILRKKLDEGQIDIPDAAERDAIAKGYQGGVDPIEVFRKRFGEDPLQDLDEIADELNRARDFKEIDNILKRNKLFDIEPKKDYGYQEGSYTDEEMAALLKKSEEDPEGFAKGGKVEKGSPKIFDQLEMDVPHPYGHRVQYALGSLPKGIQALAKQLNKKFGKGTLGTVEEMSKKGQLKVDPNKQKYDEDRKAVFDFNMRQLNKTEREAQKEMDEIIKDQIEGGFIRDMKKSMDDDIVKELKKPEREILDVPPVPKGFKLSKEKLMQKFPEIDEAFADQMMDMDKDTAGRLIKMLENRRLDPDAYDRLLAEYGDTLEFQKEFDKYVRRKKNAGGGLAYLMGL